MDIDMQALRGLEKERDIRFDVLVDAIEQALLSAYHKTPDAYRHARAHLDPASGIVTIYAREDLSVDEDGIADAQRRVPPHARRLWPHRHLDGPSGDRAATATGGR